LVPQEGSDPVLSRCDEPFAADSFASGLTTQDACGIGVVVSGGNNRPSGVTFPAAEFRLIEPNGRQDPDDHTDAADYPNQNFSTDPLPPKDVASRLFKPIQ